MAEEIEERQQLKREKEENKKKEEEEKKRKEEEDKRIAEQKDKEDFKASIGKTIETQMRVVCEEVLGRKVGQGEQLILSATAKIRRHTMDNDSGAKKASEMEVLRTNDDEIVKLKRMVADMQRSSCQPQATQHEQELDALRLDNQHLIQDVIGLKEQVNELVKLTKMGRSVSTAIPVAATDKGRAISTPNAGDYVKMSDAYRRLRDEKDMAEREVVALKERISRIGASMGTPTSVKRKRITRNSISPPSNFRLKLSKIVSPTKAGGSGSKGSRGLKFVKLKDETREGFDQRV
ncbi:hypothetical protein CBR_g52137 [Chara braunii]|uniref:Uncharacterized protein n=1 Tax=Chara braunii TaxID=69332 RepID=A0A388M9J5_CHABU|nr:hypothetical protein CBR_g52137 [Chara braunii]|eukprot:GBG91251.1 hypothetical protein CBR_g52137 [Chara braunii]